MKVFTLKADFTFEAEDIEDAFGRLSQHFDDLLHGLNSQLILEGQILVEPVGGDSGDHT